MTDLDCDTNQLCLAGFSGGVCITRCVSSPDCGKAQICTADGICNGQCVESSDCPSDHVCLDEVCRLKCMTGICISSLPAFILHKKAVLKLF